MNVEKYFSALLEEWGDRPAYLIEKEMINLFLKEGAVLIEEKNNSDGTFLTSLAYKGKVLVNVHI